jgi:beta-lactamase class A
MTHSPARRALLAAAASVPFASACTSWPADQSAASQLKALEAASNGRLGVAALNTGDGAIVNYRADERFPFCSTFKVLLASAILTRSAHEDGLLDQRIRYTQSDLVNYSPVSEKHVADGMTVAELCAAAIQYSDNSAANLLIRLLGGPPAVTAFARSIGDDEFRLDRMETELNTAIPGDLRDTTTPAAMARSLQRLALGNALGAHDRGRAHPGRRAARLAGRRQDRHGRLRHVERCRGAVAAVEAADRRRDLFHATRAGCEGTQRRARIGGEDRRAEVRLSARRVTWLR